MKRITVLLLALAWATPTFAAGLYRWVDDKGGVHYTDQPPPPNIKNVKRMGAAAADAAPAEATQQGAPVVLFSTDCGATCVQAADYLRQRGVPFTLKDIAKNPDYAAELKKRTGAHQVPVLFVGEAMQRGYSAAIWDTLLNNAGYSTQVKAEGQPAEASQP